MRTFKCLTLGMLGVAVCGAVWVCLAADNAGPTFEEQVARQRAQGPAALEPLFAERDLLLTKYLSCSISGVEHLDQKLADVDRMIDAVGGQRYCTTSRLFWYTDLAAAQEQSRSTGKPILALRLLGNLDEELTCANSRFFRVLLYTHPEISQLLREKFVLHWESVRPVPVITVDYGDGRKLTRTITGNSIHYVLDEHGRPLDGLPGLQSPHAFQEWLNRMVELASSMRQSPTTSTEILLAYHRGRVEQLDAQCVQDVGQSYTQLANQGYVRLAQTPVLTAVPATAAMLLAMPKSAVEIRPLRAISMFTESTVPEMPWSVWSPVADNQNVELHPVTCEIIATEHGPLLTQQSDVSYDESLQQLLTRLRQNLALDTVRNEQELHRALHHWFLNQELPLTVAGLNERVYAELFLTPGTDAWLGMYETDVYTALTNGGITH